METRDLIILGGGPAGYYAAERAAEAGLSTLVFEARSLGGVCLNEGCIPTKSLLYSAKTADAARHGEAYGVTASDVRIDHAKVVERKAQVVSFLVNGVGSSLKSRGVTVVRERARIAGKAEGGFVVEAGGEAYQAAKLLVATGSEVVVPPIEGLKEGLESGFVLTSREILDLQEIPARLVIVGGGVIGLEMANYFIIAGSEVTVVEMLDEVGGAIDADIAKILRGNLAKRGIAFKLGTRASAVTPGGIVVEGAGGREEIPADKVLLSIGRKASVQGVGLEEIGVAIERGAVLTDARMRTNVPGVWAAGDVNGKVMLAHTAYREAAVAVNDMTGVKDQMRYDAIPQIIYSTPEAACVGETEQGAAEKGLEFQVAKLPMQYSGRYVAENASGDGIAKILVEKGTGRLLGAHLIGTYASEIILSAAFMVGSTWPKESLKKIVYPHPTVGEILRDALYSV